jgi:exportin-1
MPAYWNLTLQCLTEVASIQFGNCYDAEHVEMYNIFMIQWQTIPVADKYSHLRQIYLRHMHAVRVRNKHSYRIWHCSSPYFSGLTYEFWNPHENTSASVLGLEYVINISYVDDTEVFKVCLDYWNTFVLELFQPHRSLENSAARTANMMGLQVSVMPQR